MMILIRVLPMSLTKLDELHESGDGDTHQVPRLCTKSSCQDRTGNPWHQEIDIRLTRNDHFWPAAAPTPRPNPWTPKPKREPSSESFREQLLLAIFLSKLKNIHIFRKITKLSHHIWSHLGREHSGMRLRPCFLLLGHSAEAFFFRQEK